MSKRKRRTFVSVSFGLLLTTAPIQAIADSDDAFPYWLGTVAEVRSDGSFVVDSSDQVMRLNNVNLTEIFDASMLLGQEIGCKAVAHSGAPEIPALVQCRYQTETVSGRIIEERDVYAVLEGLGMVDLCNPWGLEFSSLPECI